MISFLPIEPIAGVKRLSSDTLGRQWPLFAFTVVKATSISSAERASILLIPWPLALLLSFLGLFLGWSSASRQHLMGLLWVGQPAFAPFGCCGPLIRFRRWAGAPYVWAAGLKRVRGDERRHASLAAAQQIARSWLTRLIEWLGTRLPATKKGRV